MIMMDYLFGYRTTVQGLRTSPFGSWLDSFADRLAGRGYAPWTCRTYVVLAADLGGWMSKHKMRVRALEESVVADYIEHRKTQRKRGRVASLSAPRGSSRRARA